MLCTLALAAAAVGARPHRFRLAANLAGRRQGGSQRAQLAALLRQQDQLVLGSAASCFEELSYTSGRFVVNEMAAHMIRQIVLGTAAGRFEELY